MGRRSVHWNIFGRRAVRLQDRCSILRENMNSFFSSQLDFVLFFYGLAFILFGATCLAIARIDGREESWILLGLFGFLHGGGEWLDLTALVISDSPTFQLARTLIMTASFVALMEFARRESIRLGLKMPGPWLYVPLLSLVALGGAIDGLNAAGTFARYIFGFFGAMATSLVFARLAQDFSGFTRRLAMCAAAGFAAYAFAAGVIVPVGSIWPATKLNYDWFAHVTGVPIQIVRGMLACWLAFSIWSIWGQQLVSEVSSARYTRFLRQQFIWTLTAMATILVVGWTLTEFLGEIYQQNVQQEARGDIDLLASRLAGETAAIEGMVKALAGSPSVQPLLKGGSREEQEIARSVLDLHVDAAAAMVGYILDGSGTVVASSDRRDAIGSDAPSYRMAPFFQKSITGEAGYQFVFDAHTGRPSYYASYPIRIRGGKISGVAVIEKTLAAFAADLSRFDHPYFLVDPDGVVTLTNRPDMMLQALWPLSDERRAALAQQYGRLKDRPILQNAIADATWINFGGERDFVRRRFVDHSRWSLVMLKPTREIYASRVLGIVITLLVAVMTLIYLFGKERWFHDNVQMENRLKLQDLARELRFKATTDPLTGLFNRLKFDQTLENEMSRSARYNTAVALVLYDVDHFKAVNDSHGHQVGDKVLTQLSRLVVGNIRDCDVLARWGGEEFAIMLPGCDAQMAAQAAEKLRTLIGQVAFDTIGNVTCSFGAAQYAEGDTAESLLARADEALYRAKLNGRNRVEVAMSPEKAETQLSSVA
jgi:diguanylate cyclase (GGDEF)-like protein